MLQNLMDLTGPAKLLINILSALVRDLYFISPGYPQVFPFITCSNNDWTCV